MGDTNQKLYPYRWVVLFVFAVISIIIQVQWLTFAPIARQARFFYDVSAFQIDLLSLIFLVVFILVCIPASYIIDTYGIRVGIGTGAVLTGFFGMLKGYYAQNYEIVIICQVGLAIAQPFILNAATKVASQWFPITQRAMAVGIATLAQFVGIILVMIITPLLMAKDTNGISGIPGMLFTYGVISLIAAIITLLFLKEKPLTPPQKEELVDDMNFFNGMKHILKQKEMKLMLLLFFIGLGMFNAISTCIDQICQAKDLTMEQTGMIGGIMLIAGVVGAIILPALSDYLRRRKLFIIIAMTGMLPGLLGLTFFNDYTLLMISSFIFGFFLLGAGAPVGFQYCAEVTYPAPESASQGMVLLIGQISGILFIIGMNLFGMIEFMMIFLGLSLVNVFISFYLTESKRIFTQIKNK